MGVDNGVDFEGHLVGMAPLPDAKEGVKVVHVLLVSSYLSVGSFIETVA